MNRTVVISGASSGIGLSIAKTLHASGYHVIGLSRTYPKEKFDFQYYLCDLTNEDQVKHTADQITTENPYLYALVNCAGMGISGAIEHTETAEIAKIFNVNLFGTFLLTKSLIPSLRKTENSKIINIGSVAGSLIIPFQAYYSVTKAGIAAFTEALRMELSPFKIRVGIVLPGDTRTGFTASREKNKVETDEYYQNRIQRSVERMEKDEQNGANPLIVAKTVKRLLARRNIPVYTTVGFKYQLFLFLKRILPTRFVNWILYQMYGK